MWRETCLPDIIDWLRRPHSEVHRDIYCRLVQKHAPPLPVVAAPRCLMTVPTTLAGRRCQRKVGIDTDRPSQTTSPRPVTQCKCKCMLSDLYGLYRLYRSHRLP